MGDVFEGGTNGGANRFFFDKDGDILVSGQGVSGRPEVSGNLDLLAEIWGGTVKSSGTFGGDGTGSAANSLSASDTGIATIGGKSVGGNFRFQFHTKEEAQSFIDFVKIVQDQGQLGVLFEGKDTEFEVAAPGASGRGATVISFDDGADDGVADFRVGGSGVSGSESEESLDEFILTLAEDVYDGTAVRTGRFADDLGERVADGMGPNIVEVMDDDVVLGGRGIGGSFRWDFESVDKAERFEAAIERLFHEIDQADAVAQGDLPFG
jgi:hypothetical protein